MIHRFLLSAVVISLFLFIVSCDNPSTSDPINKSLIDLTGTWRSSYEWNGEEGGLAQSTGPDQSLYIRAATGMSIAAAALAFGESEKNGALSKSTKATILTQGLFKYFVKIAASWLANMLADKYGPDFSGAGPTVGVLLCQGAAKYGVCHYMFFKSSELNKCVTLCQTSMGCFTNICMPEDIDVEMAGSFGGSQFGGN